MVLNEQMIFWSILWLISISENCVFYVSCQNQSMLFTSSSICVWNWMQWVLNERKWSHVHTKIFFYRSRHIKVHHTVDLCTFKQTRLFSFCPRILAYVCFITLDHDLMFILTALQSFCHTFCHSSATVWPVDGITLDLNIVLMF